MIQQQIMNFPYQDHLGFMAADVEPESGSDIMFPVTNLPSATSPFATPPSLIGYDENRLSGGGCGKEMVSSSPKETMREMMFRIAAIQPVRIDPETVKPRKRRNVRISSDPQSVAARHRRERISERIRILQRLVPGGAKMDTASMLEEAVQYLKFLKKEVKSLEEMSASGGGASGGGMGRQGWPWWGSGVGIGGPAGNCVGSSSRSTWGLRGPYSIMHSHVVGEGM